MQINSKNKLLTSDKPLKVQIRETNKPNEQKCALNYTKTDIKKMDNNNYQTNCKLNEDCDFELMFSNKYEPFIGSYKQQLFTSKAELMKNLSSSEI